MKYSLIPFKRMNSVLGYSRSLMFFCDGVYTDVHKEQKNRSDNEETTRHLFV
jgi:hypothetical protein